MSVSFHTIPLTASLSLAKAAGHDLDQEPWTVGDRAVRFCMVTTFYPPYSFGGDAVFVQRAASWESRKASTAA